MRKYFYIIPILLIIFYFIEPIPYCNEDSTLFIDKSVQDFLYLKVKGNSMFPTIIDNSRCVCIAKEEYYVNDIILYAVEINGDIEGILHRIVKIDGKEIYAKGDANNFTESPMKKENIICSVPYYPRFMQGW
jgi:hypothetical protein